MTSLLEYISMKIKSLLIFWYPASKLSIKLSATELNNLNCITDYMYTITYFFIKIQVLGIWKIQ